ncbi:hypothetical protein MGYG_02297 [Nannizzia gypsea CBS 118893]|uniref:Uncharacterized protein n=1 Tax=Arthroderma gypseum (strain ATCC MYA-4604 / CBS 118893) TaxID=535722 RepID=E4UQV8_ARTGP|nr:hypothetical protein MGYG_02297 [Nannizzia gypsea CBS 118893]EFQ99284.1 hypothetical protein MGYG_02297 [Nannizzia gypsea CBS 118893]
METFKSIYLQEKEIDYFAELVGRVNPRLEVLQKVHCRVNANSKLRRDMGFDYYDTSGFVYCDSKDEEDAPYDSENEEGVPESAIFTRTIHGLFDVLGRGNENTRRPLSLTIEVAYPDDALEPPGYTERFLRFVRIDGHQKTLKSLMNVDSFTISNSYRAVHPAAASKILEALPRVRSVDIPLEERGPQSFMAAQFHLPHVHAISSLLEATTRFTTLEKLTLHNTLPYPLAGINPALHKLSQSAPLIALELFGGWFLSPALFWPSRTSRPAAEPFWPSLQYLHVSANLRFPDTDSVIGGCDFLRQDEVRNYEVYTPYGLIDPMAFSYLVLSISRATLQMPALRALVVGITPGTNNRLCQNDGDHAIWIECLGSGEKSVLMKYKRETMGDQMSDEAKSQVHRRWRVCLVREVCWSPSQEIRGLWQQFVGPEGITGVKYDPYLAVF